MTFDVCNDVDLGMIRQELAEHVRDRNLTTGRSARVQSADAGLVEESACILCWLFLNSTGSSGHSDPKVPRSTCRFRLDGLNSVRWVS